MSADGSPTTALASMRAWTVRYWPVWASMLVAAVVFSWAVSLYRPLPIQEDALEYSGYAHAIGNHATFAGPNGKPTAFRTPLYPLFLGAFYRVGAVGLPLDSAAKTLQPYVLAVQLALAVATVGLIAAIGCAVAGSGLGLVAGIVAAFYLPYAWASSVLFTENLCAFLLCVQLVVAVRLADKKRSPRALEWVIFGIASGLVVLTRPEFVLWTPVPVVFALLRRTCSRREWVRWGALALAGFLLVMGPWWVRNAVSLHEFIPLSTVTSAITSANHPGGLAQRATNAFETIQTPYNTAELSYLNDRVSPTKKQISFGPRVTQTPAALLPAEEWTRRLQLWVLVLALVGLVFSLRWPSLLVFFLLPVYTVAVDAGLVFHQRHFFTVMSAVIVLAAAGLWGVAKLIGKVIGGRFGRAWRLPFWGVLVLAAVVWLVARLLWVQTAPFAIDLTTDKPLAGSVDYDTVLPWARHVGVAIDPADVSTQGAKSQLVTVTVTPLGHVDPRSLGAEVWLFDVSSRKETVDKSRWGSLQLPAAWKRSGDTIVDATGASQPFSVSLRADGYITVRLLKHPYSGGVRVSAGGSSKTLDLYSKQGGDVTVRLLTPVGVDAVQHLEMPLPVAAENVSLVLSGPRTVKLRGAGWQTGAGVATQLGSGVDVVARSGASVTGRESGAVTLVVTGSQGRIAFQGADGTGVFSVGWQDVTLVVALLIAVLGIQVEAGRRHDERK